MRLKLTTLGRTHSASKKIQFFLTPNEKFVLFLQNKKVAFVT